MIKVILFDFWGTIVEQGVWSPTKQVQSVLKIRLPFSEYIVRMEKVMMARKYDSLKEAFQNVAEEFAVPCSEQQMETLIGLWNKSWMLAYPYEEVVEALTKLRQNYTLVLVSNTDCFSINKVLTKFALRELFHRAYFSYETGVLKTEPSFFKTILGDLGVSADECVMVGDSLQSDMDAAQKAGIKGILVDRHDSREFRPKIKSVGELEPVL